jgi:hypothetical protein
VRKKWTDSGSLRGFTTHASFPSRSHSVSAALAQATSSRSRTCPSASTDSPHRQPLRMDGRSASTRVLSSVRRPSRTSECKHVLRCGLTRGCCVRSVPALSDIGGRSFGQHRTADHSRRGRLRRNGGQIQQYKAPLRPLKTYQKVMIFDRSFTPGANLMRGTCSAPTSRTQSLSDE